MRRLGVVAVVLAMAAPLEAQTVPANPSAIDFTSADHTTVIPVGQVNAGQPLLASYQGMVFRVADDPSSGVPVVIGPVIPKTLAIAQTAQGANRYRLTYAQMGLTIPACTTLPCPQYSTVLVSIGPGGTSARGVSAESDPFTAAVPVNPGPPAGPTNLKNVP